MMYTFSFRDFVDFNKENKPINLASPPQTFSPVPTFEPAPKQARQTSPKIAQNQGGRRRVSGLVIISQNILEQLATSKT